MAVLQAGAAEVDITPPVGRVPSEFGMRRAESVHHRLGSYTGNS